MLRTWKEFEDYLLTFPPHEDIVVSKDFFNKESLQRFKSILSDDDGQIANYRLLVEPSNKGIHIKEYSDSYKIHWDKVNPATDPIGHLLEDAPHHIPAVIIGSLFALVVGYCAFKK